MELEDKVIYRLPNGRELVARVAGRRTAVLYHLNAPKPERYELNSAGRLLMNGQMTAWAVADLFRTGRVASTAVTELCVAADERDTSHEQGV